MPRIARSRRELGSKSKIRRRQQQREASTGSGFEAAAIQSTKTKAAFLVQNLWKLGNVFLRAPYLIPQDIPLDSFRSAAACSWLAPGGCIGTVGREPPAVPYLVRELLAIAASARVLNRPHGIA